MAKEKTVLFHQSVLNLLRRKRGHAREKEFRGVCEYDEALTAPDMAGDLVTKMDSALFKLDILDTIEKGLDSVIASISSIEETVDRLDKDVVILKNKTSEIKTRVNELEEGARFNETELSDIKRDTKKAQFDTEELLEKTISVSGDIWQARELEVCWNTRKCS